MAPSSPELKNSRGAVEFLTIISFFNDEVAGRDRFRGKERWVERRWAVGGAAPGDRRAPRGPSAGLLQWLVFAAAPKESPSYLPVADI